MQAPDYIPQTDFSDDELNNAGGRTTVRADRLDAELDGASLSINAINENLQLLQRDDGKLRDGLIEPYNLSAATKAYVLATKWNPRGLWASAQTYAVNDMVDYLGASYICAIAHASGVFAADYAAGEWQIFVTAADAGGVAFTPTATISSTDVQAAVEELDANARAASSPIQAAFFGAL